MPLLKRKLTSKMQMRAASMKRRRECLEGVTGATTPTDTNPPISKYTPKPPLSKRYSGTDKLDPTKAKKPTAQGDALSRRKRAFIERAAKKAPHKTTDETKTSSTTASEMVAIKPSSSDTPKRAKSSGNKNDGVFKIPTMNARSLRKSTAYRADSVNWDVFDESSSRIRYCGRVTNKGGSKPRHTSTDNSIQNSLNIFRHESPSLSTITKSTTAAPARRSKRLSDKFANDIASKTIAQSNTHYSTHSVKKHTDVSDTDVSKRTRSCTKVSSAVSAQGNPAIGNRNVPPRKEAMYDFFESTDDIYHGTRNNTTNQKDEYDLVSLWRKRNLKTHKLETFDTFVASLTRQNRCSPRIAHKQQTKFTSFAHSGNSHQINKTAQLQANNSKCNPNKVFPADVIMEPGVPNKETPSKNDKFQITAVASTSQSPPTVDPDVLQTITRLNRSIRKNKTESVSKSIGQAPSQKTAALGNFYYDDHTFGIFPPNASRISARDTFATPPIKPSEPPDVQINNSTFLPTNLFGPADDTVTQTKKTTPLHNQEHTTDFADTMDMFENDMITRSIFDPAQDVNANDTVKNPRLVQREELCVGKEVSNLPKIDTMTESISTDLVNADEESNNELDIARTKTPSHEDNVTETQGDDQIGNINEESYEDERIQTSTQSHLKEILIDEEIDQDLLAVYDTSKQAKQIPVMAKELTEETSDPEPFHQSTEESLFSVPEDRGANLQVTIDCVQKSNNTLTDTFVQYPPMGSEMNASNRSQGTSLEKEQECVFEDEEDDISLLKPDSIIHPADLVTCDPFTTSSSLFEFAKICNKTTEIESKCLEVKHTVLTEDNVDAIFNSIFDPESLIEHAQMLSNWDFRPINRVKRSETVTSGPSNAESNGKSESVTLYGMMVREPDLMENTGKVVEQPIPEHCADESLFCNYRRDVSDQKKKLYSLGASDNVSEGTN